MSKTVLIVDDEMLICLDIQIELEQRGHRTLTACKASEAIKIVEAEHIDLAIVDWHLGNSDASTLVAALLQKHIPLVLCSGSARDELAALFRDVPVVSKPYISSQLLAVLDVAGETATC